jgi:predicted  nucleic acid-binding Zn-ribbon protein
MANWFNKLADKPNPGEIRALELQIKTLKDKRDFLPKQIELLQRERADLPRQINALEKQLDALRKSR